MVSEKVDVLQIGVAQLDVIHKLSNETFVETFADQNTKSDIELYLDENFTKEKIEEELEDDNNYFFVAIYQNKPVGYMKLGFPELPGIPSDATFIEIHRIYVLKEFHQKKVGAALMQKANYFAWDKGYDAICLGVWEKNIKAINFYEKWGFEKCGTHIFTLGTDPQTDLVMKKSLRELRQQF